MERATAVPPPNQALVGGLNGGEKAGLATHMG